MDNWKLDCNDEDDSCNLLNPTQSDIVLNLKKRFERKQLYVSSILFVLLMCK